MPTLHVKVGGLADGDRALRQFAAQLSDLRPFWRALGETLADDAQARWPLRRRSGKLRKSLVWAGARLGRGGVFESSPDLLKFGSAIFYSRFAQFGTKRQRATPLVHIDEPAHSEQLTTWLQARAAASGLEVTQ